MMAVINPSPRHFAALLVVIPGTIMNRIQSHWTNLQALSCVTDCLGYSKGKNKWKSAGNKADCTASNRHNWRLETLSVFQELKVLTKAYHTRRCLRPQYKAYVACLLFAVPTNHGSKTDKILLLRESVEVNIICKQRQIFFQPI